MILFLLSVFAKSEVLTLTLPAEVLMAPKTKEHSIDLRKVVIQHFLNGDSEHTVASKTLISRSTIHKMIAKYKKTNCIENLPRRGRKRITTAHDDRTIQRKVKVNRRISSRTVKAELETELNLKVSQTTVRRRIHVSYSLILSN